MSMTADLVVRHATQIFTAEEGTIQNLIIRNGAIAVQGSSVVWVGFDTDLEHSVEMTSSTIQIDASGCVVTPGFIDPHTHVVFAGSRFQEFEWRLEGKPYLEIMAEGGGILSTVKAVRAATEEALITQSMSRLNRMLAFGVTTCEAKSGYGLDLPSELKLLRVIRALSSLQPVKLVPTFLGAHTVPQEFAKDRNAYVDLVVNEMLPAVIEARLATGCDVYIEEGAFDPQQSERILRAARDGGLSLHAHAGQFSDLGGTEMAARLGASSVDHLDVISQDGLDAMAEAGTVAVLLPGAAASLGLRPPRAERFLEAGVRVALATDCNPGTSYTENLLLMAFIAATAMGLSCADSLRAITSMAARAIGLAEPEGTIVAGASADLVIHSVEDWREILYHFGVTHARQVIIGGRIAFPYPIRHRVPAH